MKLNSEIKEKELIRAALILLGVIVVAFSFYIMHLNDRIEELEAIKVQYRKAEETNTQTSPGSGVIVGSRGKPEGIAEGSRYEDLLEEYEGRRLQVTNCSVTPSYSTFKNGTTILLDGFSPDPQIVSINGQTHILNGYDVAYVTLSSAELPTTLGINCSYLDEDRFNVATILLQP